MPWPLEKEFLLTLGMAEELPVFYSTLPVCNNCFAPHAALVCQNCRCVKYCTEECQSEHLEVHQEICPKLAQIQCNEWDNLELKGPELRLEGVSSEADNNDDDNNNNTVNNNESFDHQIVMVLTKQCLQKKLDPTELPSDNKTLTEFASGVCDVPPKTLEDAEQLLDKMATSGSRDAQFGMALVCAKAKRDDDALRWTRLAAHKGLADAQVRYAMTYWLDGTHKHKVDFVQAILWLRRAMAQGNLGLSEPAFLKATNTTRMMATKYYNTINQLEMKRRGIGFQREMKLMAECGIIPAINMVWKVHSKGDWYENFFAQVEREKQERHKKIKSGD